MADFEKEFNKRANALLVEVAALGALVRKQEDKQMVKAEKAGASEDMLEEKRLAFERVSNELYASEGTIIAAIERLDEI